MDEKIEKLCKDIWLVIKIYGGKDVAYDTVYGDEEGTIIEGDGSLFCIKTYITKFVEKELKRPEEK